MVLVEAAAAKLKLEQVSEAMAIRANEELRYFVRFQRVFRNLLPVAEEALFKKRWLERYPQRNADGSFKYEWCAAMGAVGWAFKKNVCS